MPGTAAARAAAAALPRRFAAEGPGAAAGEGRADETEPTSLESGALPMEKTGFTFKNADLSNGHYDLPLENGDFKHQT